MSEELKNEGQDAQAEQEVPSSEGTEMTFTEHLEELRQRLVRCIIAIVVGFLGSYAFSKEVFNLLMQPLVRVLPPNSTLIFTSLPEAFFTYLKVSLVTGIFAVSPYIFYQLWQFIAPGLYENERKYLLPIAFFSGIFFIIGALFGYFIVFPFGFQFFMGFATELIRPMPTLREYFSFCVKLLFAFGLIFELPLFIFFLARLGMVTSSGLRKKRKYAILIAFVVSAILTPPDVVTQTLMAGPLIILYELGVWIAYFFGKKEKRAKEDLPSKAGEN
ncbi:MAG: sec-independent protein translocase protein TatC [Desulfonauticus sp.]|nr:sec-independent protein translocase protein TatC [Desulfonauticus sp.]